MSFGRPAPASAAARPLARADPAAQFSSPVPFYRRGGRQDLLPGPGDLPSGLNPIGTPVASSG